MAEPVRERRQRARGDPSRVVEAARDAPDRRERRLGGNGSTTRAGGCARARRRPAPRRRRRSHGARQGAPHARPPRREARPARLGSGRRSGARARAPRAAAHPGAPGANPGSVPASLRPGRDARRCPARVARDLLRDDRLRDRAHLRPRGARLVAAGDRVGPLSAAALRRGEAQPARAAHRGAGLRALPPARVPRPEAVLDRGPRLARAPARRDRRARRRERHAPDRARHGASRPPQRDRAHARPPVRVRARRVRGRADDRRRRVRSRRRHRRREVPPRRRRDSLDEVGRDPAHARVEPEPPRGRRPRRRGDDARRADRPRHAQGSRRPDRRASGPDPRRRRVPRAGCRRRDAQPSGAARLLDRRHAPRDREQPGRLHDRSRRRALDPPLERPREGLRRADHPRQRRRPGGGALGGAARDGVPPPLLPRRRDRPRRLPAARPQRAGRSGVHAALDGAADRASPARARAVREAARRGRRPDGGRGAAAGRVPPKRS